MKFDKNVTDSRKDRCVWKLDNELYMQNCFYFKKIKSDNFVYMELDFDFLN